MDQWPELKELLSNLVPPALSIFGNAALTAVLYGFQYVVEINSPCPCDPEWNATHSDLAFSIPTIVLFLISVMVVPSSWQMFKCGTCSPCPECEECCNCKKCRSCDSQSQSNGECCCCWNTFSQVCFVLNTLVKVLTPSVIWIVLLLLDGDYVACYFAPSVNRTHGHQKCKEFCSLESSSSLRKHCFGSRILGSIILILSVTFLVLLKFVPRWTFCDCTKEGYYKFKYQRALEKKNWNKMKEELGKMAEGTADREAKELISKLKPKLGQSHQGEQNSNHGEPHSNQGEPNPNQGEQSSNQGELSSVQGEQSSNQGELSSTQGAQSSNQGEQSTNQSAQSSKQGEQSSNQGAQSSNQGAQSSNQGEQSTNQGEQSSNQGAQSSNQGEQSTNQGEQSSNQGAQSSNQGAQSTNQGEQSSKQGEQSSNQGEQSTNQGEQSSKQGEQSTNQGAQSSKQGEQSFNQTRDINADEAGPSESSA